MTPNCLICSLPLGDIELTLEHKWHYDCEKCLICGNEVNREVIESCLKDEREISHKPCWDLKMEAAIAARPVEVTQGLLDYLNEIRLTIEPEMSRTIDDNQLRAESHFNKWIHQKSIDEIFMTLRKLQAVTACCSILLNERQKKEVSVRINAEEKRRRDSELKSQVASAEEYRETDQKKLERKREKQSPEGKSITQLMKIFGPLGWTEDQCREHLKSMKTQASESSGSVQ